MKTRKTHIHSDKGNMLSKLIRYFFGRLFIYSKGNFFKPKTIISTVNGIKYELDLSQSIDAHIHFFGYFEHDVTKCIAKFTKQTMTVLDIGANIGCHTLPLAHLVGNTGKVIAFEPMEWARKKLIRNCSLNQFDNIIIEEIGLSDKIETQALIFKSNWPIDGKHRPDANIKQNIQFETLDNYVKRMDIKVDLIKIDVDGYEYKIFRGAQNLLETQKPIIITEVGHTTSRVGESVEEMVQFLLNLGYDFYSLKNLKQIKKPMAIVQSLTGSRTTNMILMPSKIV